MYDKRKLQRIKLYLDAFYYEISHEGPWRSTDSASAF
jgi:hypothetical protein